MTPEEVLRHVAGAARVRQLIVVRHARERMHQRGLAMNDLYNALKTAKKAAFDQERGQEGRWLLSEGTAVDGEPMNVAVELNGQVIVVTVW